MAKKHGPNKENLEATRRVFLQIARKDFSTLGYYDASTAQIVAASGMARGSLYYHFGDKKGLFRAVYEELMEEMRSEVMETVKDKTSAWERFIAACLHVLDMLTQAQTRRIVVDVHTAITYGERLEILQRTLLLELQNMLRAVFEEGYFKGYDPRALGLMIFGFISEGGRSFELASDIAKARQDLGNTFVLFMEKARG